LVKARRVNPKNFFAEPTRRNVCDHGSPGRMRVSAADKENIATATALLL
jgi:hypothetical protein